MNIIDLHCDTIMDFCRGRSLADMDDKHISLEKLKKGDVLAQCFAIFVLSNGAGARFGLPETPEGYFDLAYESYLREMEKNKDVIRRAFSAEDILRNRDEGFISSVLTVEDGVTLNGRIENVDEYHKKGVRMVALTWNFENSIGYPNSFDHDLHMKGLKPFGKEAVRRMNEVGIIVDVSHLSEGGFYDVYDVATKPFIASHSCARALCDHSRNLTDDQLRKVAEKGGIVGLNYYAKFLHEVETKEQDHTTLQDLLRHFEYMYRIAGIDTLALGSDYDGMGSTLEWGDCGGNILIEEALNTKFTAREVDQITHENALRVFKDAL